MISFTASASNMENDIEQARASDMEEDIREGDIEIESDSDFEMESDSDIEMATEARASNMEEHELILPPPAHAPAPYVSDIEMATNIVEKLDNELRSLPRRDISEKTITDHIIYRVPQPLRDVNSKAYTPLLISIGPFHRGLAMGREKLRYFEKLSKRKGMDKKKRCDIVISIKNQEDDLRSCYSEKFNEIKSNDFVEMILLDAVFIIEFFLESNDEKGPKRFKPRMTFDIREELMLLENQLPLFIIEQIYDKVSYHSSDSKPKSFLDLATCYLKEYLHLQAVETSPDVEKETSPDVSSEGKGFKKGSNSGSDVSSEALGFKKGSNSGSDVSSEALGFSPDVEKETSPDVGKGFNSDEGKGFRPHSSSDVGKGFNSDEGKGFRSYSSSDVGKGFNSDGEKETSPDVGKGCSSDVETECRFNPDVETKVGFNPKSRFNPDEEKQTSLGVEGSRHFTYLLRNLMLCITSQGVKKETSPDVKKETRHLTDLLRNLMLCETSSGVKKKTSPDVKIKPRHLTDLLRNLMLSRAIQRTYRPSLVKLKYSAIMLRKAGVRFQVIRDECLVNITFDRGVLKIPLLEVDHNFERLVRNIMAMEECLYEGEAYICSYIKFMDHLIDTAGDVGLLVENGIILHWLGDDAAVSNMINNLCKNIGDNYTCFGDISQELNAHYENPWNHRKATLKLVYFPNIWRGTGTVAAAILLILTLMQTIKAFL